MERTRTIKRTKKADSDEEGDEEEAVDTDKYLESDDNALTLARVKINALKMLSDRGYTLDKGDTNILNSNYEELVKDKTLLKINKAYTHKDTDSRLHIVFLTSNGGNSINKPIVQRLLSSLGRGQKSALGGTIRSLVIIGDSPLGAKAIDKLLERKGVASEWFIQFFLVRELLYLPTEHEWCPKYVKLTEEEKINLRRTEGISFASLALLRYADLSDLKIEKEKDKFFIDPVCKYYGFQPNDIVKEIGRNISLNFLCPIYQNYRRVGR